jgi:hypothetical protein
VNPCSGGSGPDGRVSDHAGNASAPGHANGTLGQATFSKPDDLLFDDANNLFVSDSDANQVRMIGSDGQVSLVAGDANAASSSSATVRLNGPRGLARLPDGRLLVADFGSSSIRQLRKNASGGWEVSTYAAGSDFSEVTGFGLSGPLSQPERLAVDASGAVYVSSSQLMSASASIPTAKLVVTTAGKSVEVSPFGGAALLLDFSLPGRALVVNVSRPLDSKDSRQLSIVDYALNGQVLINYVKQSTGGFLDGNGQAFSLSAPKAVAVNSRGDRLVADAGSQTLWRWGADGGVRAIVDNLATPLGIVAGLAADTSGNFYVADQSNNRILKVDADGLVSLVANVNAPSAMAYNRKSQMLLVVDEPGKLVRQVSPQTGLVTPFNLSEPINAWTAMAIASDARGDVYLTDATNKRIDQFQSDGRFVRGISFKLPSDSQVSGLTPVGLVVDDAGDLFVACWGRLDGDLIAGIQYMSSIRKVNAAGVVRTIAGNKQADADGPGDAARFRFGPSSIGLALGQNGDLYLPDTDNAAVKQIR